MTNGLRNHPGPTRIRSYADEQRAARWHRLSGIVILTVLGFAGFYALVLAISEAVEHFTTQ
jgi:hypothetical protein